MSHVDDGELTAYADGAYTPGEPDAQRISLHLAECANCRNRLAQAQALSGRAAEILSVAAPASFSVPNFETVRAAAKPRRRMPAIPLTWAASVLLAVGLGWFGRDAMLEQQRITEVARPAQKQAAEENEAVAPFTADEAGAPPSAPVATAPAPAPVRQRSSPLNQAAGRVVGAGAVAGEAVDLAEVKATANDARESAIRNEGQAASSKMAAAPPPPAAAPSAAALSAGPAIEYITVAEAERRNIALHRVPELEVLRVGLAGDDVRIEQKLPDGKIVTLNASVIDRRPMVPRDVPEARQEMRKAREADMAAQVGAAAAQPVSVSVIRGSTYITISGPLNADSLRVLAAKVR